MELKQAFFILEHGSFEGEHKYLEAVEVIKEHCIPAIELIALRNSLYESSQITMGGLKKLNMLIGKYDSEEGKG